MSNRSTIAVENPDGTIWQIYCHWDGDVAHNGVILYTSYNEYRKIKGLIELGALSSLGDHVHPTGTHNYQNRELDVCVYYGRDNDEDNVDKEVYNDINSFLDEMVKVENNYIYRYKYKKWYHIKNKKLEPLRKTISRELKEGKFLSSMKDKLTIYECEQKIKKHMNKLYKEMKTKKYEKVREISKV